MTFHCNPDESCGQAELLADAAEVAATMRALDLSPLALLEYAWSRADPRFPDAFAGGLEYLGRSLETLRP